MPTARSSLQRCCDWLVESKKVAFFFVRGRHDKSSGHLVKHVPHIIRIYVCVSVQPLVSTNRETMKLGSKAPSDRSARYGGVTQHGAYHSRAPREPCRGPHASSAWPRRRVVSRWPFVVCVVLFLENFSTSFCCRCRMMVGRRSRDPSWESKAATAVI